MYGALLRSLDSLSFKTERECKDPTTFMDIPVANPCPGETKKWGRHDCDRPVMKRLWLTEASLSRVTEKVLSNAEMACLEKRITNGRRQAHKLDYTKLNDSGLSETEKNMVEEWVQGRVSGRHCLCMLTAFEAELSEGRKGSYSDSNSAPSSSQGTEKLKVLSPDYLHSLLATMVSFPRSIVDQKTNVLYEKVFAKPPIVCLFETLKAVASRAKEKSTKFLGVEQINLAFKQIRLEKIKSVQSVPVPDEEIDLENDENITNTSNSSEISSRGSPAEISMKTKADDQLSSNEGEIQALRIMMELVRLFYAGRFSNEYADQQHETGELGKDERKKPQEKCECDHEESSIPISAAGSMDALSVEILKEVEIPQDKVVEQSKGMSHTDLDRLNRPIKTYISQLALLKTTLSSQLRDIEESGAYLDLGVTRNMSDKEIKKAYHSLAVKVHPDKPGGDTAQFQALQASYHEIVAARKAEGGSSEFANSSTLEGTERALALEMEISVLVTSCKSAAEQIGVMAQVVLHALKEVEKTIGKTEFPKCAHILYMLLMGNNDGGEGGPIDLLMNTVEPTQAIAASIQVANPSTKTNDFTSIIFSHATLKFRK